MKKIILLLALITFQACAAEKYDEYKSFDWHCVALDSDGVERIIDNRNDREACEWRGHSWRYLSDHDRDGMVNAEMDKAE